MPAKKKNFRWGCDVCFTSLNGKRVVSLVFLENGEEIIRKGLIKEYPGSGMILHYHKACAEKKVNIRKDRSKVECSTDFLFDSVRRREGELKEF